MKRIERYLDIRWDKHKKNWDTVVPIVGQPGIGKSNLLAHMVEYWQTKRNGKCTKEDVKHMCLTKEMWVNDLADAEPNEITGFDEAGELSSRSALTSFNKAMMIAYQVIRADRIFTVLVLPDLWHLDSYFRNSRIKGLFHVYKRGRVAFWSSNRVKRMCAINQSKVVKNYHVVKPTFYDTFPIYKGVMNEEYQKLKSKKTKESRVNLKESFASGTGQVRVLEDKDTYKMLGMYMGGMTQVEIAKEFGMSREGVRDRLAKVKSNKNI